MLLFGGLGIAALHHLAERVFADSLLFPFALSLIGLAVIGAGLLLHRHATALERSLQDRLPNGSPRSARRTGDRRSAPARIPRLARISHSR